MGIDNQLRLDACILAPAPPLTGKPNGGRGPGGWINWKVYFSARWLQANALRLSEMREEGSRVSVLVVTSFASNKDCTYLNRGIFCVLRTLPPSYRERRVERHSNIYKPFGISDVYYCLII